MSVSSIFVFPLAFGFVVVSARGISVLGCIVRVTIRARTISARREMENLASVSKTRAVEGLWVGVPSSVTQRARR